MASLSITKIGTQTYRWTISGLNLSFNSSNYIEAGITKVSFTSGSSSIGTIESSVTATSSGTDTSVSGIFAITTNGTYKFYAYAQALNSNYYSAGDFTITHTNSSTTRPENWEWNTPKVSKKDYNVSNSEWVAFQNRINEFRLYKKLSAYQFSKMISDTTIQASVFRETANAIHEISPDLGVALTCRTVQPNDYIYAWYLNNLRDALNNVV